MELVVVQGIESSNGALHAARGCVGDLTGELPAVAPTPTITQGWSKAEGRREREIIFYPLVVRRELTVHLKKDSLGVQSYGAILYKHLLLNAIFLYILWLLKNTSLGRP